MVWVLKDTEIEMMARSVTDMGGAYLVPAFTGLVRLIGMHMCGAAWVNARYVSRTNSASSFGAAVIKQRFADGYAKDADQFAQLRIDGGMAITHGSRNFLVICCNYRLISRNV